MIFMSNEKNVSRRNFIKNSSLGLSAGMVGASIPAIAAANPFTGTDDGKEKKKLPRYINQC
jgi:anaerobic selenocysteine-containing dehydrogenase